MNEGIFRPVKYSKFTNHIYITYSPENSGNREETLDTTVLSRYKGNKYPGGNDEGLENNQSFYCCRRTKG